MLEAARLVLEPLVRDVQLLIKDGVGEREGSLRLGDKALGGWGKSRTNPMSENRRFNESGEFDTSLSYDDKREDEDVGEDAGNGGRGAGRGDSYSKSAVLFRENSSAPVNPTGRGRVALVSGALMSRTTSGPQRLGPRVELPPRLRLAEHGTCEEHDEGVVGNVC